MSSKKKAVGKKKDEVAELEADIKRIQADFINFKRRADEERGQIMDYAKKDVILQLLPLVDDISRAIGHLPEDLKDHSWAKGVVKVAKQVNGFLGELGVERIEAEGAEFNPELHEAVNFEDGDGTHEVVAEELQAGYKIGDHVIRPAMVKVTRSTAPSYFDRSEGSKSKKEQKQ